MGRCSNDLSRVKLKNTFNMSDQVYIRWLEMALFAAYKRKKGHFQPNTRQSYGNPGPKGVILGPFLDPLLGQSGLKRPLNLKKGVPKRGHFGVKMVILGSFWGPFFDPLLSQSGSKRPVVLKKGVPKRGQKRGPKGVISGLNGLKQPFLVILGSFWDPLFGGSVLFLPP
jgi:hypothetical protein